MRGFRGEVVHVLETDKSGGLLHYKVQDPSLHNWFGLALAAWRGHLGLPPCNKSFDLSTAARSLGSALFSRSRSNFPGRQTIADPRNAIPTGFRGLPVFSTEPCAEGCDACLQVCPSQAIASKPLSLDLGRCVLCGDCARACPQGKIAFSDNVRLAATTREALVISEHRPALDPVRVSSELRRMFGRSLKLRSVSAGGCNGC